MSGEANDPKPTDPAAKTAFEQAGEERPLPIWLEFCYFLRDNKKWWLTPILLVMALVGLLAVLAGTGAAPFIYTMF
jgi:hypothetical protein